MGRLFEMMGNALAETWQAVIPWLAGLPAWVWAVAVTVVLLGVALRLLLPRTGVFGGSRPELFLSRAELMPAEGSEGGFQLLAAFSNLHHEPVQLLCIAARGGAGELSVVDATALVSPRRAVELEAELALGGGEGGVLELYLYVPASNARAWRLRVPLAWEPWARRYKADTLRQSLARVSHLPEPPTPPRDTPPDTPPETPPETSPETSPEPAPARERLNFPDDF